MKIGDKVKVHPEFTLNFADDIGTIIEIYPEDYMPIRVRFEFSDLLFKFSQNELLLIKEEI